MAALDGFVVSGSGWEYDGLELWCPVCRKDVLWELEMTLKMTLPLPELIKAAADHRCTLKAQAEHAQIVPVRGEIL